MARKGEKIFKVMNIKNGGIYLLGEDKLKSEAGEWEMVVEEALVPAPTVNELKLALKEKDIEFKGNASRETLEKLLSEED
jgi:hypothetical protein